MNDYGTYERKFDYSLNNFKRLTDPKRINVKPDRIEIKTVNKTASLRETMLSFSMPQDRLEELSLINGMMLNDSVQKGSLIKIIQ